jgi:hypothetical protein
MFYHVCLCHGQAQKLILCGCEYIELTKLPLQTFQFPLHVLLHHSCLYLLKLNSLTFFCQGGYSDDLQRHICGTDIKLSKLLSELRLPLLCYIAYTPVCNGQSSVTQHTHDFINAIANDMSEVQIVREIEFYALVCDVIHDVSHT